MIHPDILADILADILGLGLLSGALVAILYGPGLRVGLNLADEGYLWLGVREVLKGRSPIRDFRSYDPGRYYWCALLTRVLGGGLLGLRRGLLVTQAIALTVGGAAVLAATGDWPTSALACMAFVGWLRPHHKQFDHLMAMLAVLIATLLALSPDNGHHVVAGVFVSVCLFAGLNHAFYAGGGLSVLALALMVSSGKLEPLAWFGGGVAAGLVLPLGFLLLVPGMAAAYWRHKVVPVLRRGTANLRLPVPWLWRRGSVPWGYRLIFTVMPGIYGLVLAGVAVAGGPLAGSSAVLLAGACIGTFYMHHAYSRADVSHLAQSIAPLLFTLVVAAAQMQAPFSWIAAALLAAVSLKWAWAEGERRPRLQILENAGELRVDGQNILIPRALHNHLEVIAGLVDRHCPPGAPALFAPNLVMLYPLLDRPPAVYDTFCVYPATEDRQRAFIAQLTESAPRIVVINNHPMDRREDLRFSRTHPSVCEYLHANFRRLEDTLPPDFLMFVADAKAPMGNEGQRL